ncbi:G1/S-specific cyclin-D2-like [Limulus polyphemus]|uniref:G1/S-specific cyclin-D2-like n=1 Tax=Limulus polyphemus TaxID=6850 RepID=A0ABM1B393_LIMPO|nr:G1/S-specific cyclin-D2-like [Limulus polyphemus]
MDELGLLCSENTPLEHSPRATYDPNLLHNQRVLELLLTTEDRYTVSSAYWKYVQTEVRPFMRKVVTTWMLEVCEEQNCEETVFPVAVNYLDRFLAKTSIMKSQLQLLGAVCLLLASKFRQCRHLTADVLVYYTDYSVTREEVLPCISYEQKSPRLQSLRRPIAMISLSLSIMMLDIYVSSVVIISPPSVAQR